MINSFHVGLAVGPTEVHKGVIARKVLGEYAAEDAKFPSYLRDDLAAAARENVGISD